jgi:hypothetical protein
MSALSPVVSLEKKVYRMMHEGLVEGLEGRPARLSYTSPFSITFYRRIDPSEAGPSSLDLLLVQRREVLPCLGLEAELMALDDEARRPRGGDGLGNLLDLVEGKPELLSLLLEERRRKLRTFLEDGLGLLGNWPELRFDDEISEFPRVFGGFIPETNKRIGHA